MTDDGSVAHAVKVATNRLPGHLQRVLRDLEGRQRGGGKVEAAQPLLRRVELDDVVYLPEVGRARTPLRMLVLFLVPLAFVGLVFAIIAWLSGEAEWFIALSGAFVGSLGAAIVLSLLESILARRRRRGVEFYGLVLTADALVLWGPRVCRLVPRPAVVRLLAERRSGRSASFRECIDVITREGEQRWILHPRQHPGLRHTLSRWHRDERPWAADDPLAAVPGRPPLTPRTPG